MLFPAAQLRVRSGLWVTLHSIGRVDRGDTLERAAQEIRLSAPQPVSGFSAPPALEGCPSPRSAGRLLRSAHPSELASLRGKEAPERQERISCFQSAVGLPRERKALPVEGLGAIQISLSLRARAQRAERARLPVPVVRLAEDPDRRLQILLSLPHLPTAQLTCPKKMMSLPSLCTSCTSRDA